MPTIQESWLTGEIHTDGPTMYGPLDQLARPHFKEWSEEDVRQCWQDLENVLDIFIKKIGTKNRVTNHLVIISKNLGMLELINEYQLFLNKWNEKFLTAQPQPILYSAEKNSKITLPLYLEHILGSLFILKNASTGDISAVMDMYSILSSDYLREIKISFLKDDSNRIYRKEISKKPRTSTLNFLILQVLKNPDLKWKEVLNYLKKFQDKLIELPKMKPIKIIKEITETHIIWINKQGKEGKPAAIHGLPRRIHDLKMKFTLTG